jgi:DNA-binding NtrC family response regulator
VEDKKILIIDDDQDILNFFNKFFKSYGATILPCSNLIECIEGFDSFNPDLILLDLKLEFESGMDFLKYRESMPSLHKIPVVIISSHSEAHLIKECIKHGNKDFIKKPFGPFEEIHTRLMKIDF